MDSAWEEEFKEISILKYQHDTYINKCILISKRSNFLSQIMTDFL